DLEVEDLGRSPQPHGMFGALEHLPAIGALALEHAACVVQAVGQQMDVGLLPRHELAVVPDDAVDIVERDSHGLSPGCDATSAPRAWALFLHRARGRARVPARRVLLMAAMMETLWPC